MGDHRTDHLLHVIVSQGPRRCNSDFTTTKQAEVIAGHAGKEPTTATSDTPPTSLAIAVVATEALTPTTTIFHLSLLPMSRSKDKALQRGYDAKAPPSSNHTDLGFPPELPRPAWA